MHNFKHLKEFEAIIWERCLQNKIFNGSFQYDVHVGEGFHDDHEGSCTIVCDDFKTLTQKRIDVVNNAGHEINLIEITPKLSSRVLGQCMVYKKLYTEKFPTNLPVFANVVVEEVDEDLLPIFKQHGISVVKI